MLWEISQHGQVAIKEPNEKMTHLLVSMSKESSQLPCLQGFGMKSTFSMTVPCHACLLSIPVFRWHLYPLFICLSGYSGMKEAGIYLSNASCCLWHVCCLLLMVLGLSCYMTGFDRVNQLLLFLLHEIPIRLCASLFKRKKRKSAS